MAINHIKQPGGYRAKVDALSAVDLKRLTYLDFSPA